jgi:mevalonate kinase
LCNLIRERGPDQGFYGAKISGGGAGGTVVVMMDDTEPCHAAIEEIMAAYRERTDLVPECFRGSSPGALTFGVHRID